MQGFHSRSSSIYLLVCFLLALLYQDIVLLSAMLIFMVIFNYRLDRATALRKMLRFTVPVILLILVLNGLINQSGENMLWSIRELPMVGDIFIYREAVYFAIAMSVKLLLVLSIFTVFNILVPVEGLFDIFGSQTGKAVLVMGISARMIPELAERARAIRDVQDFRGIKPVGGHLWQRVRAWGPLLNNLLRSSLESSLKKAEAMQVRAYGSSRRSIYLEEEWNRKDSLLTFALIVVFLLSVFFYYEPQTINNNLWSEHIWSWAYAENTVLLMLLSIPIFFIKGKYRGSNIR